jgi:hypothetical protein
LNSISIIKCHLLIENNPELKNLDGFDSVTSIGGYLEIGDNEALESLQALHNLSALDGGMMIYMNESLSSLAGLDNIHAGTIIELLINNNSLLSTCEVKSVCDYLSNPNGPITIENNAVGCDNPGEVLEACVAGVGQLDNSEAGQLDISVYPNPAEGIVDFRISIFGFRFERVILEIYDVNGRARAIVFDEFKPAGDYIVLFDASVLEPGIYFYRLTTDGQTAGGKLIVMR